MNPLVIIVLLIAIGAGIYFYLEQEKKTPETITVPPSVPPPEGAEKSSTETDTPVSADGAIKVDGLIGWWDGNSYDDSQRAWTDKSSAGNNITEISGLLKKSKNGEEVQGDVDAVVAFPENMLEDLEEYTFISVAKYNGENKRRIFTTSTESGENFLFGFYGGKSGVYHTPSGWKTPNVNHHGSDWTLSVVQPKLYRSNQANRTGFYNPLDEGENEVPTRMTINGKSTEKSDWSVKEMIVYNRNLKAGEYLAIEDALVEKYKIKPNRYETSTLTGGGSAEAWPQVIRDVPFKCGKGEALNAFGLTSGMKTNYVCMSGVDIDGSEIPGQTIFEEVRGESEYFKNLQNKKIDCGERPINSLGLVMDDDEEKIRYEYVCNNSLVKNNTCQTIYGDSYATGTSFGNMTSLTNTKCPPQHVITAAKLIPDATDATKQKWELTCCKPKGI